MYTWHTKAARAGVIVVVACCTIVPQAWSQTSSMLALADGRTIEVIGLRRWTIGMLQDSLAKYAPADSLQSHACAAVLRYTLHFADAASTRFQFLEDKPEQVVVTVREPQDSARVRYHVVRLDTLSDRPQWRAIVDVASHHQDVFWPALRESLQPSSTRKPQYGSGADSALAADFATTLRALTRESDRREATSALQDSPNIYDRMAAVLVLTNFSERDDTWWSLVEALREVDGPVKSVAATALVALSERAPRAVQWSPAAPTIHALLDGTSLFVLPDLLQALSRTRVGPEYARAFLGGGGGDMVLAYLGSRNEMFAGYSHALLVALRGADLGTHVEPWRAWIATL